MTSRSKKIVLGALLICTFCIGSFFCFMAFIAPMDVICWSVQRFPNFTLEGQAHFKFPPSAHGMQVATENGSSWCAMAVRFEMQSTDLNQFHSSTKIDKLSPAIPVKWGDLPHGPLVTQLGLNINTVNSYMFGSNTDDHFNQQYIFVDTSNPTNYTVFLVAETGYLD